MEASHKAMALLGEFGSTNWKAIELPPPPDSSVEVMEVEALINKRKEIIAEIPAQSEDLIGYYAGMLRIDPREKPETYLLLLVSERISQLAAAFFKEKFNRARPVRVRPSIMPQVQSLDTPSYPQGLGLTAFLVARSLKEILHGDVAEKAVSALSERVASNRVVAGLNYPSDVDAARELANKLFPLLLECPGISDTILRAKREWEGYQESEKSSAGDSDPNGATKPLVDPPVDLDTSTRPSGRASRYEREADRLGLGVADIAFALARLIRTSEGEFSLAIFGRWGTGKTVLSRQVETYLKEPTKYREMLGRKYNIEPSHIHEHDEYHVVRFSAWQYRKPPEAWIYLLEQFIEEVRRLPFLQRAAVSLRRLAISVGIPSLISMLIALAFALGRSAFIALLFAVIVPIIGISALIYLVSAARAGRAQLAPALSRLLRLSDLAEKLGLQAVIGTDLKRLLRAWLPGDDGASTWWTWAGTALVLAVTSMIWVFGLLKGGAIGVAGASLADATCPPLEPLGLTDACRSLLMTEASPLQWLALIVWCIGAGLLLAALAPLSGKRRRLLLIVDDLDRCEPEDMVTQIEAVKLLLEDPEIVSRVQLMVLVDEDVLRAATAKKFEALISSHAIEHERGRELDRTTREHFEKLFLCHFRLQGLTGVDAREIMDLIVDQANAGANAGQMPPRPSNSGSVEVAASIAPTMSNEDIETGTATQPIEASNAPEPPANDAPNRREEVFTEEDRGALLAVVSASHEQTTPRSLRAFALKYMLARTLLHLDQTTHVDARTLAKVLAAATLRYPPELPDPGKWGSIAWAVRQVA